MPRKTEVYSWRVSRTLKVGLEEVARAERRTVAQLLDEIVAGHLRARGRGTEAQRQQRLHAEAARFAGRLSGRNPERASRVRDLVRARLRRASRAR